MELHKCESQTNIVRVREYFFYCIKASLVAYTARVYLSYKGVTHSDVRYHYKELKNAGGFAPTFHRVNHRFLPQQHLITSLLSGLSSGHHLVNSWR